MIWYIADGSVLFVGLGLTTAAGLMLIFVKSGLVRATLAGLILAGIVLGLISATPLPLWAYGVWCITVVGAAEVAIRHPAARRVSLLLWALAGTTSAGLGLAEWPHRCAPRWIAPAGHRIYVLGDSLSAAMGGNVRPWPAVLQEKVGIQVVNLARPGATTEDAVRQAEHVPEPGAMVIVEIGGNDLLKGTPASEFRCQLKALMAKLEADHHPIVMIELPLYPFKNSFGQAQRNQAARYGAQLLPKRFLAKVLSTPGATIDGLHLSQSGHDALGTIIAACFHDPNQQPKP